MSKYEEIDFEEEDVEISLVPKDHGAANMISSFQSRTFGFELKVGEQMR